jgi:FkbM family methyltransferase
VPELAKYPQPSTHPAIASAVSNHYEFDVTQKAVSNVSGFLTFNAVNIDKTSNSGISSLLKHSVNDSEHVDAVTVEVIRLDDFVRARGIPHIDFLKIDVEGMTYEVLDGIGEFIQHVACIQIETEVMPIWENQRTQTDVYALLESKGFQLIEHVTQMDGIQGDSLWARSDVVTHKIYNMDRKEWVIQS